MIFDFVREDFFHYVRRIDRSKVELRLVIGQRSQQFLLDLLSFQRVQMRAIVVIIKTWLKCNQFQLRREKNPILLTQVELTIV